MVPRDHHREHARHMQQRARPALRVPMELAAELREVGDAPRPGLCDGERCHAEEEERGREREERDDEEGTRKELGVGSRHRRGREM